MASDERMEHSCADSLCSSPAAVVGPAVVASCISFSISRVSVATQLTKITPVGKQKSARICTNGAASVQVDVKGQWNLTCTHQICVHKLAS